MFVDQVQVNLRAGNGGAGVVAFVRRRGLPRGKPNGGSGGSGGDCLIEADDHVATLLQYRRHPHHSAGSGTHGQGDLKHGRKGEDLVVRVPPGTTVFDDEGTMLADLTKHGQRVIVLSGGRGGAGNQALSSMKNRAPAFAEQGEYGEEAWFTLELKLIADAALIGFPNAGKSTLISRVSAAKPKIADYPFTTLEPNLGVVSVGEREFVLADVPGLIEGAADGKGLGHEFLRHTERARVLVMLLDPSPLQTESIEAQYRVLLSELAGHLPELAVRPRVVAVNKMELVPDLDLAELAAQLAEPTVFGVSAITGLGLEPLMHVVADRVGERRREEPDRDGYVLHRPLGTGFRVRWDGSAWTVEGKVAERAVALDDLTVPAAADFAARRLARLGVDHALRAAGANPGDSVRIGDLVFEFTEDDEEE
ncbi:MAG: GTPase ObgE [Acidimicrobiia bacterium]|nr:GTPase ObgE [Acidimicrobiia bacterium]